MRLASFDDRLNAITFGIYGNYALYNLGQQYGTARTYVHLPSKTRTFRYLCPKRQHSTQNHKKNSLQVKRVCYDALRTWEMRWEKHLFSLSIMS